MPPETAAAPPPLPPITAEFPALPLSRPRASWRTLERAAVAAFLLALTSASLLLRIRGLSIHYWVDEGISVGIAGHPLSQIPSLLRQDGSPPLYYVLLHLWMAWRGSSEVATHELSLVFALLAIPAAYWAGASLFDRRTGIVCAILAAGAPYLTTYAQETRMYSLMALLSLLVAASFVQVFVHRRRRHLPVFSLSLAGALYTHNWGLFLAAITVATFAWCVRSTAPPARRELLRDGALGFGAIAVLFLPWLPTLVYQVRHTGAPWDLPPTLWSLSQGAYSLVGGRGAAVALLLAGGTGIAAARADAGERSRVRLALEALALLGVGTLLLAWGFSKISAAWAPRYLATIVGPLLILFGFGLTRAGRLGLVALALTLSWWVLDPAHLNPNYKTDVAQAIARARPDLTPGTLVLSTQPEQVPTLAYYLSPSTRFGTPLGDVRDPGIVDWRDALARLRRSRIASVLAPMIASLRPGQRVALVTPTNLARAPLWMTLINRDSRRWSHYLNRDPALIRLARADPPAHGGVAVAVAVYARR